MTAPRNDKALREQGQVGKTNGNQQKDHTAIADLFPESLSPAVSATRSKPPIVKGQCALVLELIREHQPILSFVMTADLAIPEAAARIHDLRELGFNIQTRRESKVVFRGRERRKAAFYSLGTPEWPRPGFLEGGK